MLLAASGLVNSSYPAGSGRFASWYTERPTAGTLDLLDNYDRAFVFTLRADTELVRTIRSKVPTRMLSSPFSAGDEAHVAEFRLRQLPARSGPVIPAELNVPDRLRERARKLLFGMFRNEHNGLALIHPGSGGSRKCWPSIGISPCGTAVRVRQAVLFLSGPAESPELRTMIEGFVRDRAGMASMFDATSRSSQAYNGMQNLYRERFRHHHLAAAVGAPVIALFGPTDPALWAPPGQCPDYRRGDDRCHFIDEVFEASGELAL